MLLSIQQKYILEVLRKLGCVRRRQLETLACEKFRSSNLEVSDARLEAMLRQLRAGTNDVRIDGEFVWITGARPDALRLEAVDVMLELAEGKPEDFTTRVDRPGILRFSWGADLRLFTVAELAEPMCPTIEALAHQKRVIWLTESGVVSEGLTLPPKHFFAARMEDGSHRFYGSNGS
ncbi:MAG: hypothetical protein HFF90_07590 [Oscillibacter sp.]|nr:hypothetical protein [Oscillibacter sp.]